MVISSIDLMNGNAVQLQQGDKKILERDNPLDLAADFDRYGEIAVIDLDAACQTGKNNRELIKKICQIGECRVGGGIRTIEQAQDYYQAGAEKIIIGTSAFNETGINERFLADLIKRVPKEHIIVAVDAREGEIVTKGWKQRTGIRVLDVLPQLQPYAQELLFTVVEKEGMLQGTDSEWIKKVKQASDLNLTVAGGIASLAEIEELAKLNVNMQLGMAIYTGKFTMAEAFMASLKWKDNLLPAMAINPAGQVLMQAYMSRESMEKMFAEGNVCYFSRSRQKLWTKGETSGHLQKFRKIRRDCDGDSLLVVADQIGNACHTNSYSCFGGKWLGLADVIAYMEKNPWEISAQIIAAGFNRANRHDDKQEYLAEMLLAVAKLAADSGLSAAALMKNVQQIMRKKSVQAGV
jgi:phosphoribosyl-ATP pyrophosphohydrolase/phosphoribosyl-AMP cyclohydrolase